MADDPMIETTDLDPRQRQLDAIAGDLARKDDELQRAVARAEAAESERAEVEAKLATALTKLAYAERERDAAIGNLMNRAYTDTEKTEQVDAVLAAWRVARNPDERKLDARFAPALGHAWNRLITLFNAEEATDAQRNGDADAPG